MDYEFLNYYNKELTFMREMACEFAEKHPKIAGRLGMRGLEVADPYVERLIEAFSFISARTQLKLDAEFPLFTQRLLDIVYPNYISPTPSMGVVKLEPDMKEGDLSQGYRVPRHTPFFTHIAPGEMTRCEFRSGHDVEIWPIEITEVVLTSVPPDIPNLENYFIAANRLKGALRIKLKPHNDLLFSQLNNLSKLPIYIDGDENISSHIFELIHARHVATIIRHGQNDSIKNTIISKDAIAFEGMQQSQSLLPVEWNSFHGYNLVHEYFSCRKRFYFFTLTQLDKGLIHNETSEAEVIILLDHLDERLVGHISANRFLLYCTPVINLFPHRMDKLEIDRTLNEFQVIADRSRMQDFEVFSISKVFGQQLQNSKEIVFNPIYQTRHSDSGNYGRYFSFTRKNFHNKNNQRKYNTRTAYSGTEVFISLVDQLNAPYSDDIRYLSVEALVTNRDLPCLLSASGNFNLTTTDSAPIKSARLIFEPSAPRQPFADKEFAWRLIRQLSLNYNPVAHLSPSHGGEYLRSILRLFVSYSDLESNTQIEALTGFKTCPITRRLPGDSLLIYGRGIRCSLTVDEEGFSGASPYLFGKIMETYLARHAAINVFTETELISMQRGKIVEWQPRFGGREVL